MKREEFKTVIKELMEISDRTSELYRNSVDLIDYDDKFHGIINILLKEIYSEEDYSWIEWFMFEKNFGRAKDMKAFAKNGKEICKDVDDLFNLIEND